MDIASKVYVNDDYELSDAFSEDSTEVFDAPAEEIDVSDAEIAADIINSWVRYESRNLR